MSKRLKILLTGIFILGFLLVGRLFELQVLGRHFYKAVANQRNRITESIPAARGKIYVSDGKELRPVSTNIETYNLIAVPVRITDPSTWLDKLASYIGLEKAIIENSVIEETQSGNEVKKILTQISQKNDFYEILKKDLSIEEVEEIKKLNLEGLEFEPVFKRYWPEGSLFSHITGFARTENNQIKGQYGLEEFFNEELAGEPGKQVSDSGPGGQILARVLNKEPEDGSDLILTIDPSIQFFVCKTLAEAVTEHQADGGTIIILEPETSAVIAFCNTPDFDPNQYKEVKNFETFKNVGVSSAFELGSVFKIITMAAALDAGKITPETTYIDTGSVTIGGQVIKNAAEKVYGLRTMTNVLEWSINTGAVFAAKSLGRELFRNYLKKFGFGSLTEIELAGETFGNIENLEKPQDIYLATASFGQGISVTPIQMVNAVSAIANQGRLMKPHLVKEVVKNGASVPQKPKFIRQVISPKTATTLTAMMVSVLENGYGKMARVPGYYVAGKTGTAQVPEAGGGYSTKTIHSFVGFAPATRPKFAALIKLDNPKNAQFSESTTAPAFGKIAEFILKYYNVLPDRE